MTEQLPGKVVKSSGRLGFDCVTRLNSTTASRFADAGFEFCIRYISRSNYVSTETTGTGSISRAEAEAILSAGLSLMPVQFAKQDFAPTAAQGTTLGNNAAANATALGFPPGCSVWVDIEAINANSTTDDVIAYCNAWYDAVSDAGYRPGIYVGPNSKLSTNVLYRDLKFESYWKSASWVGNVNTRGYQMWQSLSQTVFGVNVDLDLAGIDSEQGRPYWVEPDFEQIDEQHRERLLSGED